jgi:hypothetical protein
MIPTLEMQTSSLEIQGFISFFIMRPYGRIFFACCFLIVFISNAGVHKIYDLLRVVEIADG